MKILVFAHQLEVGGTQTNAIELSATLRDQHGCEVVLFAAPGPMIRLIEEKGLRYLPAPEAFIHPSPARSLALCAAVRRERPDLIHAWDWWQCVDAYYSAHLLMRIPMVVTDMSSDGIPRILPKALPTTFGVPELVDQARAAGRKRLEFIPPPVDVQFNAPGTVDTKAFRERCGIEKGDLTLVTVSRLAAWLKSESLRRTIDCVRRLGRELPLKLVIVGDGEAKPELERLANEANTELGRTAVVLPGAMLDPRPAYAAADIMVGMGSSALRGMAFGKPVIVVGKQGFSSPFTPETADFFYYKGFYGCGDNRPDNAVHIADIRRFAAQRDQLPALGEFSRQFVLKHFALEAVAAKLEKFCRAAVADVPGIHVAAADGLRTAAICLRERRMFAGSFRARFAAWRAKAKPQHSA